MSLFRGMLLFDVADKPIGSWEEDLGFRGMIDVWRHKEKGWTLYVQNSENPDNETEQEIWIDYGDEYESIAWASDLDLALVEAKEWMSENQ